MSEDESCQGRKDKAKARLHVSRGRVHAGGADAAGSTAVRESGESTTEGAEGM